MDTQTSIAATTHTHNEAILYYTGNVCIFMHTFNVFLYLQTSYDSIMRINVLIY